MCITITYDDGHSKTWEDIATFDFYDRDDIETIAGRELTDEEFSDIKLELEYESDITSETVSEVVNNYIKQKE